MDHDLAGFVNNNGINHLIFNMKGTKKEDIPVSTMKSILDVVLDRRNYPLLIHCNHGKHRTGCVVGAMRKVAGWDLGDVLGEYRSYAEPKIRENDVEYITNFLPASLTNSEEKAPRFTPVQLRAFGRALAFSTILMVIWLLSGRQMMATREINEHTY